jgi:hypothetical protein
MKLCVFLCGLACAFGLDGQGGGSYNKKPGFDFTEACFRNPSLPYCSMRDFVNKPAKAGAKSGPGYATGSPSTLTTIDAAGIDWRFADPSADELAVLDGSKLPGSSLARGMIDQLASTRGLNATEAQNVFRALSTVHQVALSVHGDTILILVTGRPADAVLPALQTGWKSAPAGEHGLLIGQAAAVDQAVQRLAANGELDELPQTARQRPADSGFWIAGSPRLAGPEAVSAGVKRFVLTATMGDQLTSDSLFQFDGAPDPNALRAWLSTLGDAKIDGNAIGARMSMDADEARRNFTQVAKSPLGQGLGAFIQSARFIPVPDTDTTVHTKPVIYGLDGGPRELK